MLITLPCFYLALRLAAYDDAGVIHERKYNGDDDADHDQNG